MWKFRNLVNRLNQGPMINSMNKFRSKVKPTINLSCRYYSLAILGRWEILDEELRSTLEFVLDKKHHYPNLHLGITKPTQLEDLSFLLKFTQNPLQIHNLKPGINYESSLHSDLIQKSNLDPNLVKNSNRKETRHRAQEQLELAKCLVNQVDQQLLIYEPEKYPEVRPIFNFLVGQRRSFTLVTNRHLDNQPHYYQIIRPYHDHLIINFNYDQSAKLGYDNHSRVILSAVDSYVI